LDNYTWAGEVLKPLLFDIHPVIAGEQIYEREVAVVATAFCALV
jgi:hypothetical protein